MEDHIDELLISDQKNQQQDDRFWFDSALHSLWAEFSKTLARADLGHTAEPTIVIPYMCKYLSVNLPLYI